jgi:diaminopimelate epimerase
MPIPDDQILYKMNGLGNQIVVMDLRGTGTTPDGRDAVAIGAMPGMHFDQLMVLQEPCTASTLSYVTIFNIDGSEAGACGNGTRCVAWLLAKETGKAQFNVETRAGILACEQKGPLRYTVDMGKPALGWADIPLSQPVTDTRHVEIDTAPLAANLPAHFSAVSMGNPHAIFVVSDVEEHELARTGPLLETHPLFPQKANISLVAVKSPTALTQKVWERGAGLTLACGSGACAALVATARAGLTERHAAVTLPGGTLEIDWRADDHVYMTGDVELEFTLSVTLASSAA